MVNAMIRISKFEVDGKAGLGLQVGLPDSPPLVLLIGNKGFVMCGYLNIDAAEKLGVAAAVVTGVSTVEDALNAEVKAATEEAKKNGVDVGMPGREAIRRLL